jgi:hypothetical protein
MNPCQWCDGSGVDPVGMPGEPCPACEMLILTPVQSIDAWCECGAGGCSDVTFYAYGIGGGWAYACPSCALRTVSEGKARIL